MIAKVFLNIAAAVSIAAGIYQLYLVRRYRRRTSIQPCTHVYTVTAVSHFQSAGGFLDCPCTVALQRCAKCSDFRTQTFTGSFTVEDFTVTSGLVDDVLKRMEKTA